jgi:hypothetical protein
MGSCCISWQIRVYIDEGIVLIFVVWWPISQSHGSVMAVILCEWSVSSPK